MGGNEDVLENRIGNEEILAIESSDKVPLLDSEVAANARENEHQAILQTTQDITGNTDLPHIDPLQLIGLNFVGIHNVLEQKATVTDWTKEGKFIVKFINGGEELATYNNIVSITNKMKMVQNYMCLLKSSIT